MWCIEKYLIHLLISMTNILQVSARQELSKPDYLFELNNLCIMANIATERLALNKHRVDVDPTSKR